MNAVKKEVKNNAVDAKKSADMPKIVKTATKVEKPTVVKVEKPAETVTKAEKAVETITKAAETVTKVEKSVEKPAVETVVKAETVAKAAVAVNIGDINVSNECKIECAANPKRAGSKAHSRYAAYENAKTIGEYLECGGLRADLRYDLLHGFLEVREVVIEGKVVPNPKLATK